MELQWWHWAVAGMVLILAELFIPSFVLVWFGLGALLVALIAAVATELSMTVQLAVWLFVSIIMVVLWFKLFQPNQHKTRIGMSDPHVVGEVGLLTHDVAQFHKGEVRFQKPIMGSDHWQCIADETLPTGTRVKIVSVEGSFVRVEKI